MAGSLTSALRRSGLEPDKLAKLAEQIQALLACKKADKKALQSCLGLLTGHMQRLCAQTSTAPQAHYTTSTLACGSASFSAWTTEPSNQNYTWPVGSLRVRRKSDVPLLPNSDKPTWVRIADPTTSEITLTKSSKESLAWLLSCVQSTPAKPHLLHCVSAADAMAEGDTVGIGGWLCTKDGLHWFSEIWSMSEVREVLPQLHKDAQK